VADFASHMFLVTGIFKERHNICCCPPGEQLKTELEKYLFCTCRWLPCCWSHRSKLCPDRKRKGGLPFLCTTMNGFFVCTKRPQLACCLSATMSSLSLLQLARQCKANRPSPITPANTEHGSSPAPNTDDPQLDSDATQNPFLAGPSSSLISQGQRLKSFGERALKRIKLTEESQAEFRQYIEVQCHRSLCRNSDFTLILDNKP
jgi:hypothetical protein